MATTTMSTERANGPAMACVLAAGIGSFVLGVVTTLAAASSSFADGLKLVEPVGPLSGKTMFSVAVWAVAWVALGIVWRRREVDVRTVVVITFILVGLGLLGTYPTFFEEFAMG